MRLAALLLIPALWAADPPKLPEPFRSISDLASTAPPEFNADALLRVVESGKLADKNAGRALIEQAFQLAVSAKFPVRMQGLPGTTTDTASGSLSQSYGLKLDVLSLQSRAVRDMLPLDPAKARDLFGQILEPTLAPLSCDDALVYEPSDYYQALSAVVNGAFTPKEKAKDEHFNLLMDAVGKATSLSEIAPLAAAIRGTSLTEPQRSNLSARLDGVAESIRQKDHKCETKPKLDPYWQSAAAQQLLKAGKKLRYGPETQVLSDADRATPQWQQQLADYLNLIADWTADQEPSNAIYYHEKCLVYTSLLDLVPSGDQSEKILADYVDFIGNSGLYQQSPAEWFVEPYTLLDRSQTDALRHSKILDAFQNSGNPVLKLTAIFAKASSGT
jgi:hypothetical protein